MNIRRGYVDPVFLFQSTGFDRQIIQAAIERVRKARLPMQEKITHRICARAADIIQKHGWCHNSDEKNGFSCYSASEALREATQEISAFWGDYSRSKDLVMQYLKTTGVEDHISIWNDAPGRTAEEVIQVLRRASEQA